LSQPEWVSFFSRPPPPWLLQTISKDASKAAAPPRLTAPVSPFQSPLIEYDAVALELVREHPLLT
jgi:hypothetical protein